MVGVLRGSKGRLHFFDTSVSTYLVALSAVRSSASVRPARPSPEVGREGAADLAVALRGNKTLQTLDLSNMTMLKHFSKT